MVTNQTYNSKENHKQNKTKQKKTTYGMRKNICKLYEQQKFNFPSIQIAHIGAEEDGGGVRWGGCQPPHKYIKNSLRYGTTPTKQPLGDSRRPQDSRGAGETS